MVDFNGFDKGVIGKPLPADSTLNNMKKYELIELLHIAESNHKVLANVIPGSFVTSDDIYSAPTQMPSFPQNLCSFDKSKTFSIRFKI